MTLGERKGSIGLNVSGTKAKLAQRRENLAVYKPMTRRYVHARSSFGRLRNQKSVQ